MTAAFEDQAVVAVAASQEREASMAEVIEEVTATSVPPMLASKAVFAAATLDHSAVAPPRAEKSVQHA